MSTDELYATLNAKLPREAIATRQQAGTTLAYIEAWYAIDMANQIFGHLSWDKHIHHLNMVDLEEVEGPRGKQWRCYYTCHLRVHVRHENQVKFTDDVGYGSGISKQKGDAIEGAVKEAVSDAVKLCLKDLGYQFGLALYDKEKKGV